MVNHKTLEQMEEAINRDAIAQAWLQNELLKDVIKQQLRNSIELSILNRITSNMLRT